MSEALRSQVRRGEYFDSVVLMQLQRGLAALPGVLDAGVVMGTPANLALLRESSLLPPDVTTVAEDLLIVVRAQSPSAGDQALREVDTLLTRRKSQGVSAYHPKSLDAALRQAPGASWVLVSVPGRFAAGVAHQALDGGRNVFLYSDNVPLAEEVALKAKAREGGRMLMGPDCGTAILHGVGLGFANRVRRGPVGLIAASGTGLQAVSSMVHGLGSGVSQAFGTGSRDLHSAVGAITARQALDYLTADTETSVIALISKPPDPDIASSVLAMARSCGKPVVVFFLGNPLPGRRIGTLHFAASLEETARLAVDLAQPPSQGTRKPANAANGAGGFVRGLFSGGTLAYEVVQAFQTLLPGVYSNTPLRDSQRLEDPLHSRGHTILDMGDDHFTVGRLHPMIDQDLRLRRLRQEAHDPEVGVVLLDVILGEGAHPDPGSEIAPVLREMLASRPGLPVGVLLVGTDEDPQDVESQTTLLTAAGASVFGTVAETVEFALELCGQTQPETTFPPVSGLQPPLEAINVGLEAFYDSLRRQGAQATHVDWRPPAGGNEVLLSILSKMKG